MGLKYANCSTSNSHAAFGAPTNSTRSINRSFPIITGGRQLNCEHCIELLGKKGETDGIIKVRIQ